MMDNYLSIGEMAKLNGLSVQALRLYSKMGLIEPVEVDLHSGYRYYDVKQSYLLDIIAYLKNLGMSLKEIRTAFDEPGLDTISQAMEGREQTFEAEIRRLQAAHACIERFQERIDFLRRNPPMGTLVFESKGPRALHHYPINSNFHNAGPAHFERLMREMRTWLLASGLPVGYFSNVSARIHAENFLSADLITYSLFIWADRYSSQFLPVETLPAADYLCIYFEGFEHELEHADTLRDAVHHMGLEIVGDYVVETIFDFPLSSRNVRQTQLCIQLPVASATGETTVASMKRRTSSEAS